MNKKFYTTLLYVLTIIILSTFSVAEASGKYTESISINGTNDVEYSYVEHEPPEKYNDEENDTNIIQNTYIHVKPYQYTTWSHYPRYNYNYYNPYGNQVIYTYNLTGIKTGPDGRMITPLMEREMYDYHMPPPPPPHINVNPNFHRPHHNHHFRPQFHHK